jgi:hypothetical protein
VAITVVGRFASGRLSNGGGGLTVTFSLGTIAAGDKLCFGVGDLYRDAITVTDDLGNTYTAIANIDDATYGRGRLFECDVATGGTATLTLTFTTAFNMIWLAGGRATGVGAYSDANGAHTTYGTSQSGSSLTIGTDGSWVVAFYCGASYPNSNDAGTPATGFTASNCADGGAGARDQAIQSIDAIKNIADSPITPEVVFSGPQYGVVVQAVFPPGGGGGGGATSLPPVRSFPQPLLAR